MLHITPILTAYILTLTFFLGCCLGSFTDCLAMRLLSGESVLHGRSHCDSCGHVLGAADLVPLFSWLFLKRTLPLLRCKRSRRSVSLWSFWRESAAAW